jgi:hypothetical protein
MYKSKAITLHKQIICKDIALLYLFMIDKLCNMGIFHLNKIEIARSGRNHTNA